MIQAELRDLSASIEESLEDYQPEDPEDVAMIVDAYIGIRGDSDSGSDVFSFAVRTPRSLARDLEGGTYLFGLHTLILRRWDYGLLQRIIVGLCERARGPDWPSVAQWLDRWGRWEFGEGSAPWIMFPEEIR